MGYPWSQLLKALDSAGPQAEERVRQWRAVIAGMADGSLRIGSRTPVAATPAWVTLEVAHGGFATGRFLAAVDGPAENLKHAGAAGRAELLARVRAGTYRVAVPELGALPVVAWLEANGETERAAQVLGEILPYFDRVRFFPAEHPRPLASAPVAAHRTVGEVRAALAKRRPQPHLAREREAVLVWAPLFDATAALCLGLSREPPWRVRAQALLDEYASKRRSHRLCAKPDKPKENFHRLRQFLALGIADYAAAHAQLPGIERLLARSAAKRGDVGTPELAAHRAAQRRGADMPLHGEIAAGLAAKLAELPADEGAADLGAVLAEPVPAHLARKVSSCLAAPLAVLLGRRILPSSEALAKVLPHLTAVASTRGVADPALAGLYAQIYAAFRRRRSLLLTDLAKQVALEELPWVAALAPWVVPGDGVRSLLVEACAGVLAAFPQTPLPNKLVKELRTLAKAAGVRLVLTEELAADIFTGDFSPLFAEAAGVAAATMGGSLYARYYGIDYARVAGLGAGAFCALCEERAGPVRTGSTATARNGRVIEQAQILTTLNLAPLFAALGLAERLQGELPAMARRCFRWARGGRRRDRRQAAAAWRQMVFFLSFLPADAVAAFAAETGAVLDGPPFLGWF